ncbi:SDR family NAD(P)-dependent oxidoreductase [bacterium]|nr:SDR family NAD(P)-dependent oxidoreductase [bacterium]
MRQFAGKQALITGAAAGIGRAIALELARYGTHCVLADIDADGLATAAREVESLGVNAGIEVCDLTNSQQITAMCRRVLDAHGGIDLLVNNAGVAFYGPTASMSTEQWNWLLSINLHAPIQITRELLPSMLDRPDAHIVNMCSIAGLVAGGRFTAYHVSKFGLIGFTEALRAEYGRRGLGVTAICPGPVLTGLYHAAAAGERSKVPVPPRWASTTPEVVARRTINAIRRNRRQIVITPMAHALFALKRFAPGLIDFANTFSRRRLKAALPWARPVQFEHKPTDASADEVVPPASQPLSTLGAERSAA